MKAVKPWNANQPLAGTGFLLRKQDSGNLFYIEREDPSMMLPACLQGAWQLGDALQAVEKFNRAF